MVVGIDEVVEFNVDETYGGAGAGVGTEAGLM